MSKTLIQDTNKLISIAVPIIGERNLQDLEKIARDITAEYVEINRTNNEIDDLIAAQLDLSDSKKEERDWHWQLPDKSNWVELHEDYHNKRSDFSRKIANFCNHYYAFSNFLAVVISNCLPQKLKKGISGDNFHSQVNDFKKIPSHPFYPITPLGDRIIDVNNYRSDVLNHRKLSAANVLRFEETNQDGSKIIELKQTPTSHNFSDEYDIPEDAPDDIICFSREDKDGNPINTQFNIHLKVCKSKIEAGNITHFLPEYPFDYYGHLEKYGNHWHIFTRPDNKPDKDLFYASGEVKVSTPQLWPAILNMQKYLKLSSRIIQGLHQ